MSKNMTRKGLAFGAGVSLIATGFAGVPAQAVGLDQGFVSLLPNSGTAYAVLTDGTFDLKSNYAESLTAAGRQLKFLVTDPDAQIRVDVDANGSSGDAVYTQARTISSATATLNGGADGSKERITVTTSAAHNFSVGDTVTIGGTSLFGTKSGSTNVDLQGDVVVTAAATSTTFAFDVADATVDAATVTPSSATASFKTVAASAATVDTNEVSITVANGAHFVTGDIVTVGGTFDDSASADKTGDLTLTAVDGNVLTADLTAADGDMSLSSATVTLKTPITTTTLLGRNVLVGKDLGNWRILGAADADVAVSARDVDDNSFVVETIDNSVANDMILRLVNTDGTETYSATVTAWVDNNDNNEIDATEQVSPTRSVTFYDESDLTVTSNFVAPVIGASTDALQTFITVSPELNGEQVGTAATEISGTYTVQSGSVSNLTTNTYDKDTKSWRVDGDNTIVEGTYTFRAKVNGVAVGTVYTQTVAAAVAHDTTAVVEATDNTTYVKSETANATWSSAETSTVRVGKSATVTASIVDEDDVALGAGRPVSVAFSGATTSTDWFVNGTKILDNTASVTKVYQTDADGNITMEIKSTSGANGDSISMVITPENVTSDQRADVELNWATASFTIVDVNEPLNGTTRNIVTGGSYTFDFLAHDQWNTPMSGDYQLYVAVSGRSGDSGNVSFANGRASFTVSDEKLGVGSTIAADAQLQELNTAGTAYINSADATDLGSVTINVADAPTTSLVLSSVTNDDGSSDSDTTDDLDLTAKAINEWNNYTSQGSLVDPGASIDSAYFTISSGVSAGDLVTVSGSNLFFGYADASDSNAIKRISKDSLTVVMNNASDRIYVYSNVLADEAVVTVSSKGRSDTVKVTSEAAAANSGVSLDIDAPAYAGAGSTFKVTATLKDAFGNPVAVTDNSNSSTSDIKVTYSGPGIVFGALPAKTEVDGTLSFAVLLGSNDTGTATITVSYDRNGDEDYKDVTGLTPDFSVATSVTVGSAPADAKVNAGSFLGYVAVYAKGHNGSTISWKIAGKWFKTTITSDYQVFQRKTIDVGADVNVDIYIDGVKQLSKVVTTR